MRNTISLFLALSLVTLAGSAAARDYDRDAALKHSQAAIGRTVGNQAFRDIAGQPVELDSLRGKPLVISMIYTSCYHICPTITQSLGEAVDIGREALGDDAFNVVTVGFDWAADTPERMRLFASEQRIDVPGWQFLSGDQQSIDGLSDDLGFLFYRSAKGFDHLTQTSVVDADGVVYRQVYGVKIKPTSLVEPLKELVFDTPRSAGLIEHWVNTFRLFCTVYNPNSGRYSFDYSIAMTIFVGTLCLGAIGTFILKEWRHAR